LQTDFENVPDSGSGMSRAQLPYSPADFHQIRQQPYPLQIENVSDLGSGMSRAKLPYSPTDFHQIRQQPYPLPIDLENVPDSVQVCPEHNFIIPRSISIKFDGNPTLRHSCRFSLPCFG